VKILFFTENFPPETNAAATRVYERACYWVDAGHEVTIVTCAPNFPYGRLFDGWKNAWRQIENRDGMRVVRVKTYIAANEGVARRALDFLSFMVSGSVAALFERRPDVVVATSPQFFSAVAGWLVGLLRGRPFVFELGDLWPASIVAVGALRPSRALRAMERLELFLYRQSAHIVALTEAFKKNLIRRGIRPEKITVVRNGVDLPRYSPRPRNAALAAELGVGTRFVAGYIGTIGMAHGLATVLDAADRMRGNTDVVFLLVGPGAERETLKEDAHRRGLTNVIFASPQPKERMADVWSLCDVAVIHLRDSAVFAEVIPSKMFEAMAMGIPIILAVPTGEASSILFADQAGIHIAPENPEALAATVDRLSRDADLRALYAAAARSAAASHSRETQAWDMLNVLKGVRSSGGTAAMPG
jgi:colanic acid biosynthesis glycosyl transferase WcaI